MNALDPNIAGRWSSRSFDQVRPVPPEILMRLVEAARWAPSAMNNQPWRFLAVGPEDPAALEKARSTLNRGNAWALKAPRLVFILAGKNQSDGVTANRLAGYETGMAAAQMALQAVRDGLMFHQMAGFDREALRLRFSIPETLEIYTAAAVGYPGSPEDVPGEKRGLETEPRVRKTAGELVIRQGV
jgi:nitroreductase